MSPRKPAPKARAKRSEEASPSVTFFILVTAGVLLLGIGGMVWLDGNTWVQGQKLWLISRAAALAAYLVLTLVVVLGFLISHPRNKDTWRWTKYLFPWHQALMAALFALIVIHLWFTGSDPKSGVTWMNLVFPLHSKYHPWAMMAGAIGLYLLVVTALTAALRRWVSKSIWLTLHRMSWVTWCLVLGHGLVGGTDAVGMRPLYAASGVLVLITFFWRHWVAPSRKGPAPNVSLSTRDESGI